MRLPLWSTLLLPAMAIALTAAPAAVVAQASLPPASQQAVQNLAVPAPVRLQYAINGKASGFPYSANGELLWQQDGAHYTARLEIRHFLLGSRVQTSRGLLTPRGLEPQFFGDKVRSEVVAHFDRDKGTVSFSAGTPDVPLQPGAQDQLSVFMQLAAMAGGAPARFPPGSSIEFQAIGPRSSEQWNFKVGAMEALALPGGAVNAIHLSRDAEGGDGTRGEVWLAPEMGFLPVRIRLTQSNGDFVEQQWRGSQIP